MPVVEIKSFIRTEPFPFMYCLLISMDSYRVNSCSTV